MLRINFLFILRKSVNFGVILSSIHSFIHSYSKRKITQPLSLSALLCGNVADNADTV